MYKPSLCATWVPVATPRACVRVCVCVFLGVSVGSACGLVFPVWGGGICDVTGLVSNAITIDFFFRKFIQIFASFYATGTRSWFVFFVFSFTDAAGHATHSKE